MNDDYRDYRKLAHGVRNEMVVPVFRLDTMAMYFKQVGRPKCAEVCQVALDAIDEAMRMLDGLARGEAAPVEGLPDIKPVTRELAPAPVDEEMANAYPLGQDADGDKDMGN